MEGNKMKMREALEYVKQWREDCISEEGADNVDGMMAVVNAALSDPARQCDVGSADEQVRRFSAFCDLSKSCRSCPVYKPNFTAIECFAKWAQMSYDAERKGD